MAVGLPFRRESTVPRPPEIGRDKSGRLRDGVLVSCGIRRFEMTADAARSVRAMVGVAARSGIRLDATGTYRRFQDQLTLFLQRYEPCTEPEFRAERAAKHGPRRWPEALELGHPSEFWRKKLINGRRPADAASPGSSTHGLGVTIDWARSDPSRPSGAPIELDVPALQWLAAHAPEFGMWNTSDTEAWHFSHFGPGVTPAVEEFEAAAGLPPLVAPGSLTQTIDRARGRRNTANAPAAEVTRGATGTEVTAQADREAHARTKLLFLGNPRGNDPVAVQVLRQQLNSKLHLGGTGFELDETTTVFDADIHAFVVAFQERIQRFVVAVSAGAQTFEVDGRVGDDTWFWLFA